MTIVRLKSVSLDTSDEEREIVQSKSSKSSFNLLDAIKQSSKKTKTGYGLRPSETDDPITGSDYDGPSSKTGITFSTVTESISSSSDDIIARTISMFKTSINEDSEEESSSESHCASDSESDSGEEDESQSGCSENSEGSDEDKEDHFEDDSRSRGFSIPYIGQDKHLSPAERTLMILDQMTSHDSEHASNTSSPLHSIASSSSSEETDWENEVDRETRATSLFDATTETRDDGETLAGSEYNGSRHHREQTKRSMRRKQSLLEQSPRFREGLGIIDDILHHVGSCTFSEPSDLDYDFDVEKEYEESMHRRHRHVTEKRGSGKRSPKGRAATRRISPQAAVDNSYSIDYSDSLEYAKANSKEIVMEPSETPRLQRGGFFSSVFGCGG